MPSSDTLDMRCRDLVAELRLAPADKVTRVAPLTGGVASDIALIEIGPRKICAKFALPKLKVAAEWTAPVHRNRAEYAWLEAASSVDPTTTPALYGRSEQLGGFAMEFIDGDDAYLWKTALLSGAPDRNEAEAVAAALGRIHAASTQPDFDRAPFENRADFHALRIEPYLLHTAEAHPAFSARLMDLANRLDRAQQALVHGDVSPKNIMLRHGRPVLLDAECATMGDPAFDVAFCLNHLALKAVHLPASRVALIGAIERFFDAYRYQVSWEDSGEIEARTTALLPALMLARIDGKSPVEYLCEPDRSRVRDIAAPLIETPQPSLAAFVAALRRSLED